MKNYDCVIAGGGPAGSLCAATLSRFGRRVLLVQERHSTPKLPSETLVPTARPGFERFGLGDILERAEFEGTRRQGAIWGSSKVRWRETESGARGFRIDRAAFDQALREHAARSGVEVLEGWRVTNLTENAEPWTLAGPNSAKQLVTGKVRVAACGIPREKTQAAGDIQTCALWTRVTSGSEYSDATLVEAVREGWIWWLPLGNGDISITLFADLDEVKQVGRDELFARALRDSLGPARGMRPKKVTGTICTPTLRSAVGDLLLAGDAASSVDPLSSQGVEKALASGDDCAVAANTWIEDPSISSQLLRHRAHWEARLFHAHEQDTIAFYRKEQRFSDAIFWRKRQHFSAPVPKPLSGTAQIERSPNLRSTTALERSGERFKARPAFALSDHGEAIYRIGRIEIALLLELLPGNIDSIIEHARQDPRCSALSPRLVTEAFAELYRLGFVSELARP